MNTISMRPETEIKARDDMNSICKTEALDILQICPSPTNPRKTFPEAEQADLVKSIQTHGVLQPILVRLWNANTPWPTDRNVIPTFEIIAGERRYRAATEAGLKFIPAMIRDFTDREVMEVQVIENLQREGLHPQEEADGYEQMMKVCGYTADELAEKIGKSRSYIYGRLKLTALCPVARQLFREGKLNPSTALMIARIPGQELQTRAIKSITCGFDQEILPVRRVQEIIQSQYMLDLSASKFPKNDPDLVPSAGKCQDCPKRTGNARELFPDIKSADVCTDPECFDAKKQAWLGWQKNEARAAGKKLIEGEAAKKALDCGHVKGHFNIDNTCYDIEKEGKWVSYRELLKGIPIETVLVENTKTHTLIEAVPEKAMKQALQAAGLTPSSTGSFNSHKEAEKKARQKTEELRCLHQCVRKAQAETLQNTGDIDIEGLRLAVMGFFNWSGHDYQKYIARIWHKTDEKMDAHERIREFVELIPGFDRNQLYLLMMDLSVAQDTHRSTYCIESPPVRLHSRAAALGIDPEAVREEKQGKATVKTNPSDPGTPKQDTQVEAPVAAIAVGSRVKVKEGSKGPSGITRKRSGQSGFIDEILSDKEAKVRFGPSSFAVTIISISDLELLPLAPTSAAQAHEENPPTVKKAAHAKGKTPAKSTPAKPVKPKAKAKQSPAKAGEVKKKATPEQSPAKAGDMNGHTPIAVKYRHPDDHSLMWMGRGKKPKWVDLWIAGGGSLTDLEYQPKCDKTQDMFQEAV